MQDSEFRAVISFGAQASNGIRKFKKTLNRPVRFALCFTLLLQSVLFHTPRSVVAEVKLATSPAVAQNNGGSLQGAPARVAASAVVNFSQLAAEEAKKPAPTGPVVPQVIHSPFTQPEVDAPVKDDDQTPPVGPPAMPLPSVPSPNPSANFIGMTDIPKAGTSTIVIPPDTTGAVGLTQIFATVNNNYVVQDKTTGALSAPVSMDTFWTGIGATGVFDPRTLYDPFNDRWIVSAVSDSLSANSSILVGVSQTGNPGGTYFTFRVDADSTNVNWADFPCMGFNKNWVAINVNMFVISSGASVANKALVIDYPSLRTGSFTGTLFVSTGFCAFPVTTYSSSENTLYVTTHLSSGGATYRLETITGIPPAAPAYTLGVTKTRTGGGWTQPAGQILPQSAPVAGASVCGATPCLLETQDAQVRSEPVFRNGNIFYAQTVGLPAGVLTRTAAQWTKIDTSGNFVDGGRVDDSTATSTNGGKWYNYASIAVNQQNDVLFGFSQFASNQHPAAGYTFRDSGDAAGTMRDPFIYKAGEDYYHKTFSTTLGRNRWGDYSKTQVDPSNDFDLWTYQEYAMLRVGTDDGNTGSNSSRWSTWWAKISLGPTLAKVRSFNATGYYDGRVLLEWNSTYETANLGFNVYREQDGRRVRITPQLVAGSALLAGADTRLTSGNSYAWADTPPPGKPVKYLLEDIDLNGKSAWNGPIAVEASTGKGSPASNERQATLLTRLGFRQAQLSYGLGSTPAESAAKLSQNQDALPFTLASGPAIKLSVNREGWYRVTQQELVAAGLDSRVNPRFLQLFVDGRQVPITVQGEQDGRFDPSDFVEFYGLGLDAASSDTRVYWLVAGSQPGSRIEKVQAKGSVVAPAGFPYTIERKDRTIYFSALRNGDAENFFGPVVAAEAVDQSLNLQHIDKGSASSAQLEVALQGVTQQTHQVKVLLNGSEVGSVAFGGQTRGVARIPLSHSNLRDGDNVVRLIAQAGETDVSLLDSISISYRHTYSADGDALRFTATAAQQITIDGFTRGDLRVFDVTNPDALQELATVVKWQKGSYAVTAAAPGAGQRTLLALSTARAKQVAEVRANQPSSWRQPSNGADLVIITHRDFAGSLGNLKSLRQSQGLSVAVVNVDDIYDEFSYGDKTPQAVKDFLAYAKGNWKKAPRYLLLVGDASLDPKNYLGYGDSDYVPTKLVDTQNLETASDDWLADFTGDGVEDLAIGRLPVRTALEAAAMINKIVSYDTAARSGSILLVADRNDGYNFESSNSLLRALIPDGIRVEEIDRGRLDDAAAKSMLIETINRGQKIVNYIGHGSVGIWRGNLLTNDDALLLTNARGLSLFVTMTCLNGYYQDPVLDSLAESLMKAAGGGAIAVWASTGMTEPGGQLVINQELYRTIFDSAPRTLGEATLKAKAAVASQDIRRTWVLFGDPTTKLR